MRDHRGSRNPAFIHGLTNHPLHRTWSNAKSRCYDANSTPFKDYGGRGITFCEEWKNSFQAFYDWAMANGYKHGLTLDRIDNNKGYSPDNCRWATMKEQSNNRRSNKYLEFRGETRTVSQWSEITGIHNDTILKRLKHGWSVDKTLTTPTQIHRKKMR